MRRNINLKPIATNALKKLYPEILTTNNKQNLSRSGLQTLGNNCNPKRFSMDTSFCYSLAKRSTDNFEHPFADNY